MIPFQGDPQGMRLKLLLPDGDFRVRQLPRNDTNYPPTSLFERIMRVAADTFELHFERPAKRLRVYFQDEEGDYCILDASSCSDLPNHTRLKVRELGENEHDILGVSYENLMQSLAIKPRGSQGVPLSSSSRIDGHPSVSISSSSARSDFVKAKPDPFYSNNFTDRNEKYQDYYVGSDPSAEKSMIQNQFPGNSIQYSNSSHIPHIPQQPPRGSQYAEGNRPQNRYPIPNMSQVHPLTQPMRMHPQQHQPHNQQLPYPHPSVPPQGQVLSQLPPPQQNHPQGQNYGQQQGTAGPSTPSQPSSVLVPPPQQKQQIQHPLSAPIQSIPVQHSLQVHIPLQQSQQAHPLQQSNRSPFLSSVENPKPAQAWKPETNVDELADRLYNMGFTDLEENRKAILESESDLSRAVNYLLGK